MLGDDDGNNTTRCVLDMKNLMLQFNTAIGAHRMLSDTQANALAQYRAYVFDAIATYVPNVPPTLQAFSVSVGNDEANAEAVRLRSIVRVVCQANARTNESFGSMNFLARGGGNGIVTTRSQHHENAPPSVRGGAGYTYRSIEHIVANLAQLAYERFFCRRWKSCKLFVMALVTFNDGSK